MKIDDILNLESVDEKITRLQRRTTTAPNTAQLIKDWDPMQHEIYVNRELFPDGKKLRKAEWIDDKGRKHAAEFDPDPRNRIPLPIEQDQVNIHTAFTVGNEPKLICDPGSDAEKELFKIIQRIDHSNKTKYLNKKIVRSWLSECEVAEYWYVVKDEGFWKKMLSKLKVVIGAKSNTPYRLKSTIWSPFRGDKLYPLFDERGDMVAFSRGYSVRDDDNNLVEKFMTVTTTNVYSWVRNGGWEIDVNNTFKHNFPKLPVIYSYRPRALCENIRPIRERLEKLTSNYADCIDYNFYPRLVAEGNIEGLPTKDNGDMVQISPNGKLYYLTWNQTPESAKFEFDSLIEKCYTMTCTPRLSVDALKGIGQVPSGTAFKFVFMGTLMEVGNHEEVIGEHLQRRYNFLVSAVGSLCTYYSNAAETIEIEPRIVPFTIENLSENVATAVSALSGGVASDRTAIMLAGIVDNVQSELDEISADKQTSQPQN